MKRYIPISIFIIFLYSFAFIVNANDDNIASRPSCISGKYGAKDVDPDLILKGIRHYTEECEMDNPNACYKLGLFYSHAKEKAIPKDIKEPKVLARELFKKSCDFNYSRACFVLAKFLRKEFKDQDKLARELTEKSCHLKNPYGCSALADYYFESRLKSKEYLKYITMSCELGLGRNCYELSRILKETKGSPSQITQALQKGCELKHTISCKKLDIMKEQDI